VRLALAAAILSLVTASVPALAAVPTLAQASFRVRMDGAGANQDGGWLAPLNGHVSIPAETAVRIRFEVEEIGGSGINTGFTLQYRKNGGSWAAVANTRPVDESTRIATNPVEAWPAAGYVPGESTTNLLIGSSRPFVSGSTVEAPSNTSATVALLSNHTELEYSLLIHRFFDAGGLNQAGDVFEFRLVQASGVALNMYASTPALTLSASSGLVGGTMVESPSVLGPYADANGNLYTVVEYTETYNRFVMLKSTNQGSTWSAVDTAHHPVSEDLEGVDIKQVGATLHIGHHTDGEVVYHTFRTSDHPSTPDSWGVTDQVIEAGIDPLEQSVSLEVLSDGRVRAFYVGNSDVIRYATRNGSGSWGTPSTFEPNTGPNWYWVTTVRSATIPDLVHVFTADASSGTAYHRTIDGAGLISSATQLATSLGTGSSDRQPLVPPVSWAVSGSERVLLVYKKTDDRLYSRLLAAAVWSAETQVSTQVVAAGAAPFGASRQPHATLGVAGGNAELLFADDATEDLWRTTMTGSGWGSPSELIDATTVKWVRGVVTALGFGFIYDTGNELGQAGLGTGYIRFGSFGSTPPPNRVPVAVDDSAVTVAGVSVAVGVLGNDSDPDGDALVVVGLSDPVGGSAVLSPDQTVSYVPDPGFVGIDSFTYRASDGVGVSNLATVTVTVNAPPPPTVLEQFAVSQTTTFGSVSGQLLALSASDDQYQTLTEAATKGSTQRRVSRLQHSWTFDVTRGDSVTFLLEARRPLNAEGDNFEFSYSSNGSTFLPLTVVAATSDTSYTVGLPPTLSGQVTVRVVDTNRSAGMGATDSLLVDRMLIRTTNPQIAIGNTSMRVR
jgi:hypothetical protein